MRPLLLVEDGVSYFESLRWALRRSGYVVDCVSGAQEALDYLRVGDKPALILLHCRKPDLALLARLKQAGAAVVVIAGTIPAAADADAVFRDPVSIGDLLNAVQQALGEGE